MEFLQKIFWFNFIQFTAGYFNEYERFCNFKETSYNYKPFISTFFTLLKFINDTVNKRQWVISFHKFSFIRGIFFFNDGGHHLVYFVYSVLVFWRSMVKVVLRFSDKRWIYKYHWCSSLVSKNLLGFASMVPSGIKTSWRRRNDVSLYVPATSQVRLKWNSQWRLDGTSPRRLSGASLRRLIGTS